MYEELVKRLREESEIERWLQPHSANETPKLLDDAADAIEELTDKNVGKWIPVTERLPDLFMHVLVNIPGLAPHPTVQEAFREMNGLWYTNGFRYEENDITHWMPLPEPPKEET